MIETINNNIFAQSAQSFCLQLNIRYESLYVVTEDIDDLEVNYEYFEKNTSERLENNPSDIWTIKIYLHSPQQLIAIEEKIIAILKKQKINSIIHRIIIPNKDWVSEVQNNFKPIIVDKFYIHTDNFPAKNDFLDILINPGRAFGTGEHQTTQLCLMAISFINNELGFTPKSIIDIGCGSGILAIAAKKLFDSKIIATDIDEQAIEVSKKNFAANNVKIDAIIADGLNEKKLQSFSPYDLVISNILAKPLIEMAGDIIYNTDVNGYIILSGFLDYQVEAIIQAYSKVHLLKTFSLNKWYSLVFHKTN